MSDFALCPTKGPPRLIRFVEPGKLTWPVVAILDLKHNVLQIDRESFDLMSSTDQALVIKTMDEMVIAHEPV